MGAHFFDANSADLFWLVAGAATQIVLLLVFLLAPAFRPIRFPAVVAYLLFVAVLWYWAWSWPHQATRVGAGLTGLPVLFAIVTFMGSRRRSKRVRDPA